MRVKINPSIAGKLTLAVGNKTVGDEWVEISDSAYKKVKDVTRRNGVLVLVADND